MDYLTSIARTSALLLDIDFLKAVTIMKMVETKKCGIVEFIGKSLLKIRIWRYLGCIILLSSLAIFISCSNDIAEEIEEDVEEELPDPDIITINTGNTLGEVYNFWSTRPMVNQTRFSSSNFINSLEVIKPYVKEYNLVRVLGGRTDDRNNFYQGVDEQGNVIADFSPLLSDLRSLLQAGFKPRIVLDNVPWGMTEVKEVNKYGNTNPPDDYEVWRKYIDAFLQALIAEFGVDDVKTWRFRVATEPNYAPEHWNGTKESFFKHYDITVDAVTNVIPDAIIGPGNLLTENAATFTTELIEHCANGTNYATGKKGTKMDFFCLSYYEKIDQNTVGFSEIVAPYREALNQYSQFRNIPFDIQEFGILRDEYKRRGQSLSDATEFGASWYATIADQAYQYGVTEIYDWGQETEAGDLPQGRRHVTSMFQKMLDGNRLAVVGNFKGYSGIIPAKKDNRIYLLLYNHNTARNSTASRTLYSKIEGADIASTVNWRVNEWTVDKTHGVFMHELYKDVKAAGVGIKTGNSARIYGNRPGDYFQDEWEDVFNGNLSKYTELSELPQTVTDSLITTAEDGFLLLEMRLAPHAVKLIELIPEE